MANPDAPVPDMIRLGRINLGLSAEKNGAPLADGRR
jgi:hypothetical protein